MSSSSHGSALVHAFPNCNLYHTSEYCYMWSMLARSVKAKNSNEVFFDSSIYFSRSILISSSRNLARSCAFLILVASALVSYSLLINVSSFKIVCGSDFLRSPRISSSFSVRIFSFLALVSTRLSLSCSRSDFSIPTTKESIWSRKPAWVIAKLIKQIFTQVSGD